MKVREMDTVPGKGSEGEILGEGDLESAPSGRLGGGDGGAAIPPGSEKAVRGFPVVSVAGLPQPLANGCDPFGIGGGRKGRSCVEAGLWRVRPEGMPFAQAP